MTSFPAAPANYTQERIGIAALQSFAADRGQIWRETPTGDVGIDGQLEYVNASGVATGQTLAVQVKAGASYFTNETTQSWKYYPTKKHRMYWERYPLPVILVLHDPVSKKSYWIDARQALRSPDSDNFTYVEVPKANILQEVATEFLFANAGVQTEVFIPNIADVLKAMVELYSNSGSMPLSYFDLFTQGLTNICRSLYFSMDLALNAAEVNLARANSDFGVGVGSVESDFLFGYIRFLVAQHIADVDFADCLIDWNDRQMVPKFIAPLTVRGRQLVKAISEQEKTFIEDGEMTDGGGLCVAQEGFVEMVKSSYIHRLPRIHDFQAAMSNKLGAFRRHT